MHFFTLISVCIYIRKVFSLVGFGLLHRGCDALRQGLNNRLKKNSKEKLFRYKITL